MSSMYKFICAMCVILHAMKKITLPKVTVIVLLFMAVTYFFSQRQEKLDVNSDINTPAQTEPVQNVPPAGSANNSEDSWQTFHSDSGRFSVLFPTSPSQSSFKSSEDPSYSGIPLALTSYKSATNDGVFGVDETIMTPSAMYKLTNIDPEEISKQLLDGIASADENNRISLSTTGKFLNHSSRDFVIVNEARGVKVNGKIIVIDTFHMIVLNYVYKNENAAGYQKFISSFSLE